MRKPSGVVILAGVLLLLGGFARGMDADILTVPLVDKPPIVDGDLTDAAWQQAAQLTDFRIFRSEAKPEDKTIAYLCQDGVWLYLGFRCEDSQAAKIKPVVFVRDQSVHSDDSVEFFLDPGMGGKRYYHFLMNVAGTLGDQMVQKGELPRRDWNAPTKSATRVEAWGWSGELAIPIYTITQDRSKGPWLFNICRNQRTRPDRPYLTLAPVEAGFHDPEHFLPMEAISERASPYAPLLLGAEVTGYQKQGNNYSYTVRLEVENKSGKGGKLEVQVQDIAAGKQDTVSFPLELGPMDKRTMPLEVPVASPRDRQVRVFLVDPQTKEVWQRLMVADLSPLTPLMAFLDRSYYTSETSARIAYQVKLPAQDFSKLRMSYRLLDDQGKKVGSGESRRVEQGLATLEVPLARVTPGTYRTEVALQDSRGQTISQAEMALHKVPPGPGSEVKIDRINQATLVNGKPFFPLGFVMVPSKDMKRLADAGFNCVIGWMKAPLNTATEDAARDAGLMVIDWAARYFTGPHFGSAPGVDDNLRKNIDERLPEIVRTLRPHPSLLAYYGMDEPGEAQKDMCVSYRKVVQTEDPYHPVTFVWSGGVRTTEGWTETTDIPAVDIYMCGGGNAMQLGSVPHVLAVGTDGVRAFADKMNAPCWVVPNAEYFSGSIRPITPQEQRLQTYLSLIHGAKGIIYFVWRPQVKGNWEMLQQLAKEMNRLAPSLLLRIPEQQISLTPDTLDRFKLPPLHLSLRDNPDGGEILLAANTRIEPMDIKYTVPHLGKGAKVRLLFGDERQLSVGDGAFRDRIEGYGTRAYLITGSQRKPGSSAKVNAVLSGPAVPALANEAKAKDMALLPETSIAAVMQGGGKTPENLITNPGFEEQGSWQGGVMDNKEAHSGIRSGFVEHKSDKGVSDIISDKWITLEPNSEYEFGAWARCNFSEGRGGTWLLLVKEDGHGLEYGDKRQEPLSGWTLLRGRSKTGDQPIPVRMLCRFANAVGWARFDDLFLRKVGETTKSRNLLPNSGFEHVGVPGCPDHWYGNSLTGFLGDPDSTWGPDETISHSGKRSLRVIYDPARGSNDYIVRTNSLPSLGGASVTKGKTYTFSLYMKADRENVPARIAIDFINSAAKYDAVSKDLVLGTEWKRYEVTGTLNDFWGIFCKVGFSFGLLGRQPATIWVDDGQFEEGDHATDYVADAYLPQPLPIR